MLYVSSITLLISHKQFVTHWISEDKKSIDISQATCRLQRLLEMTTLKEDNLFVCRYEGNLLAVDGVDVIRLYL